MRGVMTWIAVAMVVFLAPMAVSASALPDGELTLGVLAEPGVTQARYQPLADYLSERMGSGRVRLSVLEFDALEVALRQNRLDLLLTNPQHYIALRSRNTLTGVIATLVQAGRDGSATQVLGGVIFASAARRDLETLEDLRGARIAVTARRDLGGYVAPAFELLQVGLHLPQDAEVMRLGQAGGVIDAVLAGRADVGFVPTEVLEEAIGDGQLARERIKVINPQHLAGFPFLVSTRLYPESPFVALPHVSQHIVSRVAAALLALQPDDPAARAAGIAGFAPPSDYLAVEEATRALRLPPYDRPPDFTWHDMVERHSTALGVALAAALVIAGLVVMVIVRNRQLVHSGEALSGAMGQLQIRNDMQRTVGKAMATLLAAPSEERDAAIVRMLSLLGQGAGADRVAVLLFSEDGKRIGGIHQWVREGIKACHQGLHGAPVSAATWWWEQFSAGELVRFSDPDELPARAAAENAWFGGRDIRSLLALGVQKGGEAYGVIGLETVRSRRDWTDTDVTLLQLTADAFSSALARWKTERRLQLMQAALDQVSEAVYLVDAEGRFRYVNEGGVRCLGYAREEFYGMDVTDIDPHYQRAAWEAHWDDLRERHSITIETEHRRKDGSLYPVELMANYLEYEGEPYNLGLARDITERKRTQEQMKLAASVFSHAREGIIIAGADRRIVDVNDAFTRITGYMRDEVIGENPRFLKSGRHRPEFYQDLWKDLNENGFWSGEIWNRRKGGTLYPQAMTLSVVRDGDGDGEVVNYVAVFSDITAVKEQQRQLEHIARYDALTNLPNRVSLADRLGQAMALAKRHGQRLAVAYIDLDGFKAVNDRHGHDVGDELLVAVATRMKFALRESDTVARIGGDEFVAVLQDLVDVPASVPEFERLLEAVAQPVRIRDLDFHISASIGATFYPQDDEVDADQLLRQADQAMYQAKLAGRNRFHMFDTEQDRSVRGRAALQQCVRDALAGGGCVLHYQPKVNMRTGAVVGAEALLRLQHPERGLMMPAEFLPAIDDHPLAADVGNWVIEAALEQVERWSADSGLDIPVSVNIGAHHLQHPEFLASLKAALARHPNVPSDRLELEVLETGALQDLTLVSRIMKACRDIGVRFALDDFGTGYSSLTYLKHLPAAQLKIDQSFVRNALENPDDLAILEGVMGLAAAFQREVIAEGVETLAHGVLLLKLGCELAQGHAIAKPMPADRFPGWAETWAPDVQWLQQARVAPGDLAVIFAGVEHRTWLANLRACAEGHSVVSPTDMSACRFDVWLDGEGARRHGSKPMFDEVRRLHGQFHDRASELLGQLARGRHSAARVRLPEIDLTLTALQEKSDELLAADGGAAGPGKRTRRKEGAPAKQ